MIFDIFRLDWIFIDSVIIILLIIVLIAVKLFKERSRWRSAITNESLEIFQFNKSDIKVKNKNTIINDINIVSNILKNKTEDQYPSIFIIKTWRNRKLMYILTEGLASYGFNVIVANLKILTNSEKLNSKNTHDPQITNIFSQILNFFNQNSSISNSNYFLINHIKQGFLYNSLISDSNNCGILLINPKFKKRINLQLSEILTQNEIKSYFYLIFSKKLTIFTKNRNIKKFKKLSSTYQKISFKFHTIENAKKRFKYYETVLVAIIIDIINKISLKS